MVKTPLETTWIYHEIGRCYLELDKYSKAKDCGVKSLDAAQDFEDDVWQLNASVLVAQALGKFYANKYINLTVFVYLKLFSRAGENIVFS